MFQLHFILNYCFMFIDVEESFPSVCHEEKLNDKKGHDLKARMEDKCCV